MLDTVKINHVQHISFTQSLLTDAVSVILRELLSYEHPSKSAGVFCFHLPVWPALKTGLPAGKGKEAENRKNQKERNGSNGKVRIAHL